MAGDDCLSKLPDDLLWCILNVVPAKEGASTAALARWWHLIWPSSDAINLDSRSYIHLNRYDMRYVIMCHASEAFTGVAAHGRGSPITKFTFRYMEGQDDSWSFCGSSSYEHNMYMAKEDMAQGLWALLYSLAVCHVEELHLRLFYGPCDDRPMRLCNLIIWDISCSRALCVLHVSKCMDYEWDNHLC